MSKDTNNTGIFNQEIKESSYMKKDNHQAINRRDFLKIVGISTATTAPLLSGCSSNSSTASGTGGSTSIPTDQMTYRTTSSTKDKVSILGYGCMRLPTIAKSSARESDDEIDQEMVQPADRLCHRARRELLRHVARLLQRTFGTCYGDRPQPLSA